jgi:hypothetical protein
MTSVESLSVTVETLERLLAVLEERADDDDMLITIIMVRQVLSLVRAVHQAAVLDPAAFTRFATSTDWPPTPPSGN